MTAPGSHLLSDFFHPAFLTGCARLSPSRSCRRPERVRVHAHCSLMKRSEWEKMRAVFYRSMRAIEHALSARREYLTNGQIMQGGPDHMRVSLRRSTSATS